MKGGRLPRGYTVVEVMMFLAISGTMFVVAATFVNGKQQKAEFRNSMTSLTSELQEVINDVSSGNYPSRENFSCSAYTTGGLSFSTAAPASQGTNIGCIHMGKVVQFDADNGGVDGTKYNILTVAGRQFAQGGSGISDKVVTQFGQTGSQAAYQTGVEQLTEAGNIRYGSTIKSITDKSEFTDNDCNVGGNAESVQPGAIGFFSSFGNYEGSELRSGAQSVFTACVPQSVRGQTSEGTSLKIEEITSSSVHSRTEFVICLDSGKGDYGSVTIGGRNGQSLAVTMQIGDAQCA